MLLEIKISRHECIIFNFGYIYFIVSFYLFILVKKSLLYAKARPQTNKLCIFQVALKHNHSLCSLLELKQFKGAF